MLGFDFCEALMGIKRATKGDLTINSKAWGIVYRLVVLLLIFCVMGRQKCVKEPVPGDTLPSFSVNGEANEEKYDAVYRGDWGGKTHVHEGCPLHIGEENRRRNTNNKGRAQALEHNWNALS